MAHIMNFPKILCLKPIIKIQHFLHENILFGPFLCTPQLLVLEVRKQHDRQDYDGDNYDDDDYDDGDDYEGDDYDGYDYDCDDGREYFLALVCLTF